MKNQVGKLFVARFGDDLLKSLRGISERPAEVQHEFPNTIAAHQIVQRTCQALFCLIFILGFD